MDAQALPTVEEQPRLDIESYIQNYEGRTRFDRLLLIGKCNVPLGVDALKLAVQEALRGKDVGRYKEAVEQLRLRAPGEVEAQLDEEWVARHDRENKAETARLESELKGYRNNMIKESIRMGHEDLGVHYIETGNFIKAAESFSRMRHDITTTKHIKDCARYLISVSLQRRDWAVVLTNINKITSLENVDEQKEMQPFLKVCTGISLMGLGRYQEAAMGFLQAHSGQPADSFNDIATPNDIAVYAGFLALATMDRDSLQARVLDNTSFRVYLECEPQIRKAIAFFVNGRYANCLSIIESQRTDCLLDIYLQKHVEDIFNKIRSKCIVQYFRPFSCVTLQSFEEAFSRPGLSVLDELLDMIREGTLKAKYDAKDKVLIAVRPDPRVAMQRNALEVAQAYEKEAIERLRQINLVGASLEVRETKKERTGWNGSEVSMEM